MVDRVRSLKMEDASSGGTETDPFPTAVNPNEDFLDAAGVTLQNETSSDDLVRIARDAGDNLTFQDGAVAGAKTLRELVDVNAAQHQTLRQAIHFLEEGPGGGFASGAHKEVLGGLFPTQIIWWESSAKLKKIVELFIERSAPPASRVKPTPLILKVYNVDGTTVAQTIRDDVTYSGIAEIARTRTIS